MRRLALVLLVILLPLLAWGTPGGYPDRGQPVRGVPDRGQPIAPSGSAEARADTVSNQRATAVYRLGLFGLVNAWLDALGEYLQEVAIEEALAILGVILAGTYGVRKARRMIGGRRKTDE